MHQEIASNLEDDPAQADHDHPRATFARSRLVQLAWVQAVIATLGSL